MTFLSLYLFIGRINFACQPFPSNYFSVILSRRAARMGVTSCRVIFPLYYIKTAKKRNEATQRKFFMICCDYEWIGGPICRSQWHHRSCDRNYTTAPHTAGKDLGQRAMIQACRLSFGFHAFTDAVTSGGLPTPFSLVSQAADALVIGGIGPEHSVSCGQSLTISMTATL